MKRAWLLLACGLLAPPLRAQYTPGTVPEDAAGLLVWAEGARAQPVTDSLHLAEAYAYLMTGARVDSFAAIERAEASPDEQVRFDALRLRGDLLARRPDRHEEALVVFDRWVAGQPNPGDPALPDVERSRNWLRERLDRADAIRAHAEGARWWPWLGLLFFAAFAWSVGRVLRRCSSP